MTIEHFGKLDIAINAAGIGGPEVRTAEYDHDEWERVIDVNLNGVWRCMRHEIPAMLATGGGVIVNIASVAGLIGFPRHPAYAASKHGVGRPHQDRRAGVRSQGHPHQRTLSRDSRSHPWCST
jgi:NAD(P)-dependent dehydrogenase (short-subunit alcohol dehydrogenase family)